MVFSPLIGNWYKQNEQAFYTCPFDKPINHETKTIFYLQFHLFKEALALSAFLLFFTTPSILAQKLFLRAASAFVFGFGAGGFKLEPVSLLYLALPRLDNPAPSFGH